MEAKVDILTRSAVLTRAVADHIKDSIVYMDEAGGEAAFATYGLKMLQGAKPVMLTKLRDAKIQDAQAAAFLHGSPITKVVFVLHQLLTAAFDTILRVLRTHNHLTECLILTSFSEVVHVLETELDEHAYDQYAAAVKEAVHQHYVQSKGSLNEPAELKVWVQHFPLHVCPLTSNTFILPATSSLTSSSYGGKLAGYAAGERNNQGLPARLGESYQADTDAEQGGLRLLAHSLVGFAAQQDLRLDTFALGPASRALGDEICALPIPHGHGGSQPSAVASLLLVDRHKDLLTPALHEDHVLDCIFGQLAPRQHGSSMNNSTRLTTLQNTVTDAEHTTKGTAAVGNAMHSGSKPAASKERRATSCVVDAAYGENVQQVVAADLPTGSALEVQRDLSSKQHSGSHFNPQFSLRSADVMVPMQSPEQNGEQQWGGLEGSVLGSGQAREWLQFLMGRDAKDALLYLRKWLREAARKEDVQLKTGRSKLTDKAAVVQEIMSWSDALAAQPTAMLRQRVLLQLAYAAVHALRGDASSNWDALHLQEQQLTAAAAQGLESLANAVVDVWKRQLGKEVTSRLQLQDVMLLTCIGYWLAAEQGLQEQQDISSVTYSPWLPDQECAIKDAMVITMLQTNTAALHQLPWLQDLPDRIQIHQTHHSQLHAAGDSSSSDGASEEEEAWASLEQDSTPNHYSRQQQEQQLFSEQTAAFEMPEGSNHQQQQQQSPSKQQTAAADMPEDSDAADISKSLYHEHQQIRLELQDAMEHQLAQIRGSAVLQAHTHLQMMSLDEADQQCSGEGIRPPLIHALTRAVLQHQPIPGLYHASASLRGLLKSGLGRIGLLQPKQQHPSDHKTVIVFVLGGICMAELRSVQQAVSNTQPADGSVMQVLAGGSALTRPTDTYHNMLFARRHGH